MIVMLYYTFTIRYIFNSQLMRGTVHPCISYVCTYMNSRLIKTLINWNGTWTVTSLAGQEVELVWVVAQCQLQIVSTPQCIALTLEPNSWGGAGLGTPTLLSAIVLKFYKIGTCVTCNWSGNNINIKNIYTGINNDNMPGMYLGILTPWTVSPLSQGRDWSWCRRWHETNHI